MSMLLFPRTRSIGMYWIQMLKLQTHGTEIYVYIDYNGHKFTARFKSEDVTSEDEKLTSTFKPEKIHVFDKETEVSLLGLDTKFNFNT